MIRYEDATHTYYNSKGQVIPSVSQLVEFKFSGTYKDVPPEVLKRSADYGTKVHLILEEYDLGHTEKAYELAIDDDNMLDSLSDYVKLKKTYMIQPKSQEQIVDYHERYGGRYDKLDGQNNLWDVKTTSAEHPEKWALQLGLYYMALGIENPYGYVIHLPKGKRGTVKLITVPNHAECLKVLEEYEMFTAEQK